MRVACYIDGFNLYHAVDDLKRPHLKWISLRTLAETLCRPGENLVKVAYFSAYATWLPGPYARHRQFVAAQRNEGVECHMARFSEQTATCKKCGATWKKHEEKETDVHFSLTVLEDAMDDVFDRLILVSADSDHVPAIRKIRSRFPAKQVFIATPPERHGRARELLKAGNSSAPITAGRLERCLLAEKITDRSGKVIATRPPSYSPPR